MSKNMKPKDLIIYGEWNSPVFRAYEIDGIYMGSLNQESVISLRPLNLSAPSGKEFCDKTQIPTLFLEKAIEVGIVKFYQC